MRRCVNCGASNPLSGLTERQGHVGGVGYVWEIECVDKDACQRRQAREAQSILMQTELEAASERRRIA